MLQSCIATTWLDPCKYCWNLISNTIKLSLHIFVILQSYSKCALSLSTNSKTAIAKHAMLILSLGAGGVSKRVERETGWIERTNNPKYPLEYIRAADRLANGKRKLLFPKQ